MILIQTSNKHIALWLFLCCVLIAAMVLVGGLTRLTESGLSMVEWKPVTGVLPPLSEVAWQDEFAKYQQSPEYQKKNHGMNLSEFKQIFLWEYSHRLLGRTIGFVFFVPFLYFLLTKKIGRRYGWQFFGIFLLGALQGGIGWYMVKSGLVDRPDVSQYRLTLHLGMAFMLYALIFWTALSLVKSGREAVPTQLSPPGWFKAMGTVIILMIGLQVLSGGFVAGMDAGLVYNSFPAMNGKFVPSGLLILDPWYTNFFENVTSIQFNHRVWAMVTTAFIIVFWLCVQYKPSVRAGLRLEQKNLIHAMLIMLVIQFVLGVLTLLHAVPISLASLHQMGALALFTLALAVGHSLLYKK